MYTKFKIFMEWSLYLLNFFFHLFKWGRGLKSGENFKLLYDLADQLHAAGKVTFLSRKMFPFRWKYFFFIISFVYKSFKAADFLLSLVFSFSLWNSFSCLQVHGVVFSEERLSMFFFIIYMTHLTFAPF